MKLGQSVSSFSVYTPIPSFCYLSERLRNIPGRNLKINGKPQKLYFSFCLFLFFSFLCGAYVGKISVTCVSTVIPILVFSSLALPAHPLASPRVAGISTPSRWHCEESYSGLLNLEKYLSFVNHIRILPGQYFVFSASAYAPRGVMKSCVCSENRP